MLAIQAKNLTKTYRWYPRRTDIIKELLCLKRKSYHSLRTALEDVSFEIEKGESVGVMGCNGAGKSTLLKLLAGLSQPTSGVFEVRGRVAVLLELGTGFHPDYSGAENIRINGMLLGLSRRAIEEKCDAIIDFAELRHVIHQPLRTYSTGMQARLAFAIATALEPDILLIDEVLAVGDASFVNKCVQFLQRFLGNGGTAVLVSHNSFLLSRLCKRILWIEQGKLVQIGEAQTVCRAYDFYVRQRDRAKQKPNTQSQGSLRWGSGEIRIQSTTLLDSAEQPQSAYVTGEKMVVRVKYESTSTFDNPSVYILITRVDGLLVTSSFSGEAAVEFGTFYKTGSVDIVFDPLLLGDGSYWVSVGIFPRREGPESIYRLDPYDYHECVCELTVKRPDRPLQTVYDQPVRWSHNALP
jgi:ABC-type polysaccharide/polyol phosphate transport system ATPase subunit